MAFTNLTGTVTRTFYSGKGAEVTETFKKRDGTEGKTRWACWFENEHGLHEGDIVKVSGMHGDQVDDWTDKDGGIRHSVKRSINGAKVDGEKQQAPAQQVAADEPWAVTQPPAQGDWSDETPF